MRISKAFAIVGVFISSISLSVADHHGKKDLVDTAVAAGNFKTLAAALSAADLVGALKSDGPFTVFAPTDEAFEKLPAGTVEMLLKPENKAKLVDILTYHVVAAKVPAKAALELTEATALNKKSIALQVREGALFLNDSQVIKTDIMASNGIIHVIDTVLLPPSKTAQIEPLQQLGKTAQGIVSMAIRKGVPLFNHGNHAACTAVYEMAAETLLMLPATEVGLDERMMLKTALRESSKGHNATNNAWTMRRALDATMQMQLAMSR